MVERTKSGYHLSGNDSIEFYIKLHDPTEKEISKSINENANRTNKED